MTEVELQRERFDKVVEEKNKKSRINKYITNSEQADEDLKVATALLEKTAKMGKDLERTRAEIKRLTLELEKKTQAENKKSPRKSSPDLSPPWSIMYPIPADVQVQLYTEISHNGGGRARYLKTRTALAPNQKYRVNPTHNYIYGWRAETFQEKRFPEFGRKESYHKYLYQTFGHIPFEICVPEILTAYPCN